MATSTSPLSGAATGAAAGSAFGPWGTVIGAGVGLLGSLLGRQSAPQQAPYVPINPNSVVSSAIGGNLGNLPAASSLASQVDTFNQSEATRLLNQAIPGFSQLQSKLLGQVNADLNTQTALPPDVQDQLAQTAAEHGVSRGTSGNFNGFSLVKDFGFNLIDWQNAKRAQALNTLSTVSGLSPRVSAMSPMASLLNTGTALDVAQRNNEMAYNVQQGGLNAQAAASNYNQTLLAGGVMNAGNLFSAYLNQPSSSSSAGPGGTAAAAGVSAKALGNPNP